MSILLKLFLILVTSHTCTSVSNEKSYTRYTNRNAILSFHASKFLIHKGDKAGRVLGFFLLLDISSSSGNSLPPSFSLPLTIGIIRARTRRVEEALEHQVKTVRGMIAKTRDLHKPTQWVEWANSYAHLLKAVRRSTTSYDVNVPASTWIHPPLFNLYHLWSSYWSHLWSFTSHFSTRLRVTYRSILSIRNVSTDDIS